MFTEWEQRRQNPSSPMNNSSSSQGGHEAVLANLKPLKIDVPRFDGGDPQGWVFKIQQYFDYHQVVEDQRLKVAPFYFDGKALAWYQWMLRSNQITSWNGFLRSIQVRFGSSEFEDYQGQLSKPV